MKKIFSIILVFLMAFLPSFYAFAGETDGEEGEVQEELIEILVTSTTESETFSTTSLDLRYTLQQAMNYCDSLATESNRYTIKVPKGTYYISNTVTVSSYTTLDLTDGVTLIDNNTNIFMTPTGVGGYNGCDGFTVLGGTMTYPDDYAGNSCLVRLVHAKNITFKDTKFLNNFRSHHIELAACKNVTFEGCTFSGMTASLSETSAEALQIDILEEKEHFALADPYDGTMNDTINVKNCTFSELLRGVGTRSSFAGYYQNGINITGCTFKNITSTAVCCFNYINSSVSNNTFTNCGEAVHYYMMRADNELSKMLSYDNNGVINTNCNSTISNNTINVLRTSDAAQASAIYVFGNNITASKTTKFKPGNYYVGNIKVINNKINTTDYGIRFHDVKNSTVSGNTVYSSNKLYNAVYLTDDCDNNTVSSNNLTNFETSVNIKTSSDNNTVSSNTVTSPSKHGILVQSGCKGNSITKNTVKFCGANGILLQGAKELNVNSNSITSSKNHGICITSKSTLKNLNSNTVSSSTGNGLYFESGVTITNVKSNTFKSNKKNAVSAYGTISNLSSNKFESNVGWAVYFSTSAKASVYNNTFSKNKKGSIYSAGKKKSYSFSNVGKPSVTLSTKSKAVTVKWKKISGATSYQVYRATSKNGTYKKIATVKKNSYKNSKLTKGKKYYYKVRAVRSNNSITAYSNYSAIKSIKVK